VYVCMPAYVCVCVYVYTPELMDYKMSDLIKFVNVCVYIYIYICMMSISILSRVSLQ
jgi:hypothetical protein